MVASRAYLSADYWASNWAVSKEHLRVAKTVASKVARSVASKVEKMVVRMVALKAYRSADCLVGSWAKKKVAMLVQHLVPW